MCHCELQQDFHDVVLDGEYAAVHLDAFDESGSCASPPPARALDYMARLGDSGSSADEGAPSTSRFRLVRIGDYRHRIYSEGNLRWAVVRFAPHARRFPCSSLWLAVSDLYRQVAAEFGTPQFLMNFALGKVERSHFDDKVIHGLKFGDVEILEGRKCWSQWLHVNGCISWSCHKSSHPLVHKGDPLRRLLHRRPLCASVD